jgi:Phage integrase, N-terminal SAM-like domain
MPEFRYKMLNERGGTVFSADITADTLDGAIRQAAEVYHTSNLSSPSRRVHAFEVGRNGFAEDAGSEVERIGECILSEGGQGCPSELQRKETTMSPLRARMIEDMTLAGLAEGTQRVYVQAVRGVTAHYRRSPDLLSEEEVRGYLLGLRQRGVARGTFQTSRYGLRFFYHHTLDRAWALFGGKKDRLATTEAAA